MKRYHIKINPKKFIEAESQLKDFTAYINNLSFRLTSHSFDHLQHRLSLFNYSELMEFIKHLNFDYEAIFEFYTNDNGSIKKVCYRVNYSDKIALIFVMGQDKQLITVYVNNVNDNHKTLKKGLYVHNKKQS